MNRRTFTAVILLVLSLVLLSACDRTPQTEPIIIDWTMHGTYLNADGSSAQSVEMTVQGTITYEQNDTWAFDGEITMPDSFPYQFISDTGFLSHNRKHGDLPHLFVVPTYSYSKTDNESVWSYFALDLEAQCFIAVFEDDPDRCLVASCDPEADPQALLDHFADFLGAYGFGS